MKQARRTTRTGIRRATLLGAATVLIANTTSAFAGPCVVKGPILSTFALCNRCTITYSSTTSKDTPCYSTPDQGSGVGTSRIELVLVGSSIAKKPQHGRLSMNGSTWTYTPAKGFVGEDTFTLERDFIESTKTVHVVFFEQHMTVTP